MVVVRCPRCGSTAAESVEAVGIEFDRMACATCAHTAIVDRQQMKDDWNAEGTLSRSEHVLPDVRFHALWAALGARGSAHAAFERLRAAYDEPHRAYHDARHIGACLRLLDDPAVRALAKAPAEIEAALWFHDAIYDTHAHDNEDQSARLAEEALAGVDGVARIAAYVRATKAHVAMSPDEQIVLDIDLSILGESPEVFARFEAEIRQEYAWVEAPLYVAGRTAVLRSLFERPQVYGRALFRERYEARARANLSAAIAALAR